MRFSRLAIVLCLVALVALLAWKFLPTKAAQPSVSAPIAVSRQTATITKPAPVPVVEAPKLPPVAASELPPKTTNGNSSSAELPTPNLIVAAEPEPNDPNGRNFGVVELQDGITTKLLMSSGNWFVIHPSVLPDGRLQMDMVVETPNGTVIDGPPQHISTLGHSYGALGITYDVDFTPNWKTP